MSHTPRLHTVLSCTLLVAALGAGATACDGSERPLSLKPYDAASQIAFNGPVNGRKADPDKPLEVTSRTGDGRITDVTVADAHGRYLAGAMSADGKRWHSTVPLAANEHYTVTISTEDDHAAPGRKVYAFDTAAPKKKKTVKVTFIPDSGQYGVGQPVVAELDQPIKDKAARRVIENGLKVQSTPAVRGAWYWVDDKHLHYRPEEYWPAHATVRATSNLEGIKINDRLWGETSKAVKMTIGDKLVAITDAATHRMKVYRNDKEINDIPVTTGKPGYETRNGIKVILDKEYFVRMRSETVDIGGSESYDLPVYYATRVTWSGEFVHAAPWSVGDQGYANVSHGCTGMSTSNAAWFFNNVREGDVVKVVNSNGDEMAPFSNGYGDWNLTWATWRKGSSLPAGTVNVPNQADQARLQPEV
ncbi:Ig-like domain-containing protein [Streptomyces sp. NPDC002004]